ncbi:ABC-F family ATP-binding cassette domain-containing protein [Rhodococcus sp. MEB064]|uniref:ABC-F family ATP-binding cassette domain-containing protein n=1 Tax=Rhodococcus sp. MEB064 TaxID=1587522 RepID=UPI0005AC659C|nr:ABC-F family ATP-binding cassette domain-containing protein [Rhodococcus sp. MEB064]KIQ19870.1 ABC transporter [Rhodococcus sp. MEB064]
MSWIRMNDVTAGYEQRVILRDVFFKLTDGDRVGLIGRNGSGKTSLLQLLLGRTSADTGTVDVTEGARIGYFSQFSELDGDRSITVELESLFGEIRAVEAELGEVEAALGGDIDEKEMYRLVDRQAELLEQMETGGGWTYHQQIDTALSMLGFDAERRELPVDKLSGGWRNRAALARIILEAPDVLLLDEPTNFLDAEGIAWLERWLRDFRGALLLVSHDRHFLEQVVTTIVEIENNRLQSYDGSYSDYVQQKQFRLKNLEKEFSNEQQLLAYEQDAITDRKEAIKNPSGVLKRRLANIKKAKNPRPVDQVITSIYGKLHVHDDLCVVEGLTKRFGDRTLFEGLSFEIHRGDRIAITGPNGCGKSTLVDALTGVEPSDSGTVKWKSKSHPFIHYNKVLADLDLDDTVTHSINAMPDSLALTATRKDVARFLALLQFSELDQKQRIGALSGGQRARVALAQCLLYGAGVIVLDEPTNHLDLASTQVLERALAAFPGAVVLVSHDRFFIEKVAFSQLAFDGHGAVRSIAGVEL